MKNATLTAREALKESSADLKRLSKEIERLEAALAEARRQSVEAEAALKTLSNLDSEVAKFRSQALKAGRNPRVLSGELKEKATRKRDAEIEASQSAETVELLESELSDSQDALAKLRSILVPAAGKVLIAELLEPLAERMGSLQAEFWALNQIRAGFTALSYFDERGARISLGDANDRGFAQPQFPLSVDPIHMQARRWRTLLDALLSDPTAALKVPDPIMPSDLRREDFYAG